MRAHLYNVARRGFVTGFYPILGLKKATLVSTKDHWESVYSSRADAELSWMQSDPQLSLSLIAEVCPVGAVIDVGGGTSLLAGKLLDRGYSVTVLDISKAALKRAQDRLGSNAARVCWIVADLTASPDLGSFDVWHDRAVFHFLTNPADRVAYVALMERALRAGGHAVIATFALEGPEKCSGLTVRRYSGQTLGKELGDRFKLLKSVSETHVTPGGKPQSFQYSVFCRI
jgi:SAM-dependent methyltransferase